MTKYFKTNDDYFNFLNKKKDGIIVKNLKILKSKIKLVYEITQN